MALLLALAVALIPLAIAPGAFFYFDVTPKIVLLLLATAAAAIWWAWAGARAKAHRASLESRFFFVALCGIALSLIVSTLASVNRAQSFSGSSWRYWGLLTHLTALAFAWMVAESCAGQPGARRTMLRAIAASGLIGAAYGIAQYFGWDPLLDPRGYQSGEGVYMIVRPPGTLGHADYFANWLLFTTFGAVALAFIDEAPFWKWLARASAALGCVAILLGGNRAAAIGLVAGAILLIVWRGPRPTKRSAAMALVVVVAALGFYVSPAGARLRARVHWILEEPAGGARFLLWRDSLRMASARWLVGFGPETYISAFARYQSPELGRAYPDFYHESPHNIFLDALIAQGVAGPSLLLALCGIGFAAAWRVRKNPAAGALSAALLAMTLSGQFACFMMPTALAYYVTVALLVSLTDSAAPEPVPARGRWMRLAVAAPCAIVLSVFAIRMWLAESALAAARSDLDWDRVSDAAGHYAEYQHWRWPGGSADLWYSRRLAQIAGGKADRMVRLQAFQEAGAAAQRATQTCEAPFNAYYNLAAFNARRNDFPATERSLRSAISYAPNWFKTHWMLAQVLQAAGRLKEAEAEAATAVQLDGGKHAEVTSTLEHIRGALQAPEPAH